MKRIRSASIFVTAALLSMVGPSFAADSQAPLLTFPKERDYYRVITPGMDASPSGRSVAIRQPTQLRAVVLGKQRALLWLETSAFKSGMSEQMGFRMTEMSFVKPECAAREVGSMAGDGLQIKRALVQKSGFLSFGLLAPEKTIRAGFSEQDLRFMELTKDPATSPPDEPKISAAPKDGRIQLLPLASPVDAAPKDTAFQQTIWLRSASDGQGIEFAAEFNLTFGQYATKVEKSLPLADLGETVTGVSLAATVGRWLAASPEAAGEAPLMLDNGKLCVFWFKSADRILAVDLQRLQTAFLSKLLADEQSALAEYDFTSRDFMAASRILGHLLLAEKLADLASKSGNEMGVTEKEGLVTSIKNARAHLEELVFRLPAKVGDDDWVVFYKPDKRKARLLPDAVRWTLASSESKGSTTPGRALQFKVPNRDLVFLMTVQASPSFTLVGDKISALQKELADQYQNDELRTVNLETGLPDDFTAALSLGSQDAPQLPSAEVKLCKRDAKNRLLLKLAASELEAVSLLPLFLGANGKGLPLDLGIDQFFLGRTNQKAGAVIKGQVTVPDFQIVEARDEKIPVAVWVDARVFAGAKSDKVTIPFRYLGETATYAATIDKDSGSGVVDLPLKTVSGATILDIEYQSPVNQKWIVRAGGVEGLVLVDQ